MKSNLGTLDRTLRTIAGVAIIGVGIAYDSWWGAVGVIPLVTALVGWCPLYYPLKISTAKK